MKVFPLESYNVCFGDFRRSFAPWYGERRPSNLLVVTDHHTRELCWPLLRDGLEAVAGARVVAVPAGEKAKNLASAEILWDAMHAQRLDRQSLVLAVGGGMVTDLAGFCAATYKRGVPFAHVPTTLLAATDAAIGGKTGLNFHDVKNALGVIQDPVGVFADPVFFKTLSARELRSGLAEVIKHALIGDAALWQQLLDVHDIAAADWSALTPPSIAVKVRVVREDPREKDLRRLLNYGHTIGHAIESYGLGAGEPLTHGEAVAIGLVAESYLAWGDGPRTRALAEMVTRFFGHHAIPETSFAELWQTMQHDKKNERGSVRVAVPGDVPFSLRILEPGPAQAREALAYYNACIIL